MALPRKGTRTISIEAVEYRYLMSKPKHMGRRMVTETFQYYVTAWAIPIAFELAADPRSNASCSYYYDPDHNVGLEIGPGIVEGLIRLAVSNGWKPDQPGNFHFEWSTLDKFPSSEYKYRPVPELEVRQLVRSVSARTGDGRHDKSR